MYLFVSSQFVQQLCKLKQLYLTVKITDYLKCHLYGIEKWFTEKVSAKDTNRPKLQELLEFAREGIEIAKRNGKYKGGKRKTVDDFAEHYARYMSREISKSALARELNISRPTLDKLISEYNQKK